MKNSKEMDESHHHHIAMLSTKILAAMYTYVLVSSCIKLALFPPQVGCSLWSWCLGENYELSDSAQLLIPHYKESYFNIEHILMQHSHGCYVHVHILVMCSVSTNGERAGLANLHFTIGYLLECS